MAGYDILINQENLCIQFVKMTDEKSVVQEFKLDPDCELRFEVESKNEKVTLEVIKFTISTEI